MNAVEFLNFYNQLVKKETEIFTLKGEEYSGSQNRFANFERIADKLGLHPVEVLAVYFYKHIDSIDTYIKDKKVYSDEDIIGRVSDARNYLALLGGMITKYRNLPQEHTWHLEDFNSERK